MLQHNGINYDPLSDRQYPSLTYNHNSTVIPPPPSCRYKLTMDSTEAIQISNNQALSVGWIGLGSMGLAMAVNIQKHLKAIGAPNLHYWNRTISKGQELAELGGVACENVADVPRNCAITFISVSPTASPSLTTPATNPRTRSATTRP